MPGRFSMALRAARGAGHLGHAALSQYLAARAARGAGYEQSAAAAHAGGGRRRSRGITAHDMRTTNRTLRKIVKLYHKLPHRTTHSRAPWGRRK